MHLREVSHWSWMCRLFDKKYASPCSKDNLEQLGEYDEDRKYILQLQWIPDTVISVKLHNGLALRWESGCGVFLTRRAQHLFLAGRLWH